MRLHPPAWLLADRGAALPARGRGAWARTWSTGVAASSRDGAAASGGQRRRRRFAVARSFSAAGPRSDGTASRCRAEEAEIAVAFTLSKAAVALANRRCFLACLDAVAVAVKEEAATAHGAITIAGTLALALAVSNAVAFALTLALALAVSNALALALTGGACYAAELCRVFGR